MVCSKLVLIMIFISLSLSHARRVKQMKVVSAVDNLREFKEAHVIGDGNDFSSIKEYYSLLPSTAKLAQTSDDEITAGTKPAKNEMFNDRQKPKSDDQSMTIHSTTMRTSSIETRKSEDKFVNDYYDFVAEYHPPKAHPGINN